MRKTKLVITVGPALLDGGPLRECLELADVVRINASHNTPDERTDTLLRIRAIAAELGKEIPVFLDLQGPKWRVAVMEEPVELVEGETGFLYEAGTAKPEGSGFSVPVPHPELFQGAKPGQMWLLDDGALQLKVLSTDGSQLRVQVVVGGLLKSRKGIHPIGLDVNIDPLTPKDLQDIYWGVEKGVDLFAQSFVRKAADVQTLAARIREAGGSQPIIAKIEHPHALDNLDEILELSWGVMVARGDLGVELGVEKVPTLQKRIIGKARQSLKPVITATQMLESMIEHPQPTRAEASDVANAIWDGTDAVMLSAESAAGKYPLDAVQWLARIAEDADMHQQPRQRRAGDHVSEKLSARTDVAVAFAACRTAEDIGAKALVVFTEGGGSARMVSRLSNNMPIIGATTHIGNARLLGMLRGVQSLLIHKAAHMSEMEANVYPLIRKRFGLEAGDRMVVTLGHPLWTTGTTNTIKVVMFE